MRSRWLLILAMLVMPTVVSAQATQPADGTIRRSASIATDGGSKPASPGATRVALSLAAVLGLIVILFWAAKRFLPRRALGGQTPGGGMQLLARLPVAPKQSLLLVQVGRRLLVIGDSGTGLSTLCEITDPNEAAALIGQLQTEKSSFTAALNSAAEKFRAAERPSREAELDTMRQEIDGLVQRVRGIAQRVE
jgi:flagellar biosynthetic protein FliO